MERKLIFFDIDGTLLDHEKKLPASARHSIFQLKKAGHQIAIATGRGPFMFKSLREELGIDTYVSYNGQYVESKGEPIHKNPITPSILAELTKFADGHEHPIVYMDKETMKSNSAYHVHIEESFSTLNMPHPEHDSDYFRGRDIYQCIVFCSVGEETQYLERFAETLDFIRWHPLSIDVLPKGGTKAEGIKAVIERLGVTREDIVAFGDQLNDIEMLEFAGVGVAMGNAPDIVKRAANHVTRHVEDDGIQYGLQMLGLL